MATSSQCHHDLEVAIPLKRKPANRIGCVAYGFLVHTHHAEHIGEALWYATILGFNIKAVEQEEQRISRLAILIGLPGTDVVKAWW